MIRTSNRKFTTKWENMTQKNDKKMTKKWQKWRNNDKQITKQMTIKLDNLRKKKKQIKKQNVINNYLKFFFDDCTITIFCILLYCCIIFSIFFLLLKPIMLLHDVMRTLFIKYFNIFYFLCIITMYILMYQSYIAGVTVYFLFLVVYPSKST